MFFVGGVGVIQVVFYVCDFVVGYSNGIVVVCKVIMVWVIQIFEYFEWICFWMIEILVMEKCCEVFKIMLFVSRFCLIKEIYSFSLIVQMFFG